ncbi:MAG: hypothetical protein NTW84_06765 [Methanothrix sp.]|nr:hypothetical protein [Methanothrix sp.]
MGDKTQLSILLLSSQTKEYLSIAPGSNADFSTGRRICHPG